MRARVALPSDLVYTPVTGTGRSFGRFPLATPLGLLSTQGLYAVDGAIPTHMDSTTVRAAAPY